MPKPVLVLLAVGLTFVILTGGIDLSVGAIIAFSSVAGVMPSRWASVPTESGRSDAGQHRAARAIPERAGGHGQRIGDVLRRHPRRHAGAAPLTRTSGARGEGTARSSRSSRRAWTSASRGTSRPRSDRSRRT